MSVRKINWGGEVTWHVDGHPEVFKKLRDALAFAGPDEKIRKVVTGDVKTAWAVDYKDREGKRHHETFPKKKDADARHAEIKVAIGANTHTPTDRSVTVASAAANWIEHLEGKREAGTIAGYKQHVRDHIKPLIGNEKLAMLTRQRVATFCDELEKKLSTVTARKVLVSFKSVLKHARVRRFWLNSNPAEGVSIEGNRRGASKLQVGVDVPSRDEIARILAAAKGKARPILITAVFTGMRASELRGLRWSDVDLERGELHVRQRADRFNRMGKPKTKSSERAIPIGPTVVNTLREWKLACPKGDLDLVFPNGRGNPENHGNIYLRYLRPTLIAAGVTNQYGLHAFRHFFASWCANRRVDGGRELPIKTVQTMLGHSSILMTSDTYGHLFPRADDSAELAAAELDLIAVR